MKTAEQINDIIQNMQPGDDFTLADAVLAMLEAQKVIVQAALELDGKRGLLTNSTRNGLRKFAGRESNDG